MGSAVDFIGGSQPPKSVFSFSPAANTIRLIQIRDYKSDDHITYIPESSTKKFCDEETNVLYPMYIEVDHIPISFVPQTVMVFLDRGYCDITIEGELNDDSCT